MTRSYARDPKGSAIGIFAPCLIALVVAGCVRESAPPPPPVQPPKLPPVDPVACEALLPFLPKAPDGYKGQTPHQERIDFQGADGDVKYSFVKQQFKNGAATLSVQILDTGHVKDFYDWIEESATLKESTDTGSATGVKLDGNPAIERYWKADRKESLIVMLANRFQIEITATGVEPGFVRGVYETLDRKALAALKK